jgi:hypothetical protein
VGVKWREEKKSGNFLITKFPKKKKRCNNSIKNLFDLRNPLGIYKFWSNSEIFFYNKLPQKEKKKKEKK